MLRVTVLAVALGALAGCGSTAAATPAQPAQASSTEQPADSAPAAAPEASPDRAAPGGHTHYADDDTVPTGERGERPDEPGSAASAIVAEMRDLRDAAQACSTRTALPDEAFVRCACPAICGHRFQVANEEGGSIEVRYPLREVDGLSFAIEPDGTVPWCRYTDGARLDVSVRCGE